MTYLEEVSRCIITLSLTPSFIGLHTNLDFLRRLAMHPAFKDGQVETGFIPKYKNDLIPTPQAASADTIALASLAVVLREGETEKNTPWSLSGFRLNHKTGIF
jgi:3-methylcrotonyl-CoA carboxylase alpha subunit